MRIGSTPITDIKVGSTQITKVIRNGITYWEVDSSWTPQNLYAISDSSTQITLTWANPININYDGISIEKSLDGISYSEIDTIFSGETTYVNTGLTAKTKYYYRVRYYKGTNFSLYSNVDSDSTIDSLLTRTVAFDYWADPLMITSWGVSSIHAMIYKNHYLHCFSIGGQESGRIKDNDYTVFDVRDQFKYSSEVDTTYVYSTEQAVSVGNFIYITAYKMPEQIPCLIQIDSSDFSYKIFKITNAYGLISNIITTDGTNIYLFFSSSSYTIKNIVKYAVADFQNPSWSKFNTAYDNFGVPIVPVAVLIDVFAGEGINYNPHASEWSDGYLYISYLNPVRTNPSKFVKINTATMIFDGSTNITQCSDDIVANNTYVFLGAENKYADNYNASHAIIAIKKSDLTVTVLRRYKGLLQSNVSFGVFILNIGGTDYLFNMGTNSKIYIYNINHPETWSVDKPAEAYIKRIIGFTFVNGDVGTPNEILLDSYNYLHVPLWMTNSIGRFPLTALELPY